MYFACFNATTLINYKGREIHIAKKKLFYNISRAKQNLEMNQEEEEVSIGLKCKTIDFVKKLFIEEKKKQINDPETRTWTTDETSEHLW